MIINYILLISLLFMSVIKMTDIFKKANHQLNVKREDFISLTKKHHEDGSLSVVAASLTLMISALLYLYVSKFSIEIREARYRKASYLCFNHLNIQTENYIADMTKLNWLLRTAFAAQFTGVATAKAKVIFEGLKITRNARHLQHIKRLSSNQYCQKKDLALFSYMKNLPYKTKSLLILDDNVDGTVNFRSNEWMTTQYAYPLKIRTQKTFCLKAAWSVEGNFNPNLKVSTKEIGTEGFSKLKCLPGWES